MLNLRSAQRLLTTTLLLMLGAGLSLPTHAQISADRPGFGDGATTIAPGTFQAGLGYALNGNGSTSHELGQLFLRYGLLDGLELRGGVNSYAIQSSADNGYNGTDLGAKVRLFGNPISALSGVLTTSLPTGTGVFAGPDDRARQEVKLAFDGALGQDITLSINGGTSFYYASGLQDDRAFEWLFIPTLSFSLTENAGAYVGYAGFYDDNNENWVEGGLTFLSGADTQLDVNTGLRLDEDSSGYFVGLGVARRF